MARPRTRKTETKPEAEHDDLPAGATDFDPAALDRQPPAEQTPGAARPEHGHHADGHAEQLKRPRPRSTEVITDTSAKMRMHSNHESYKVAITFDDGKPSEQVRELLKDAGFRWSQSDQAWEKSTYYETRVRDRLDAERAFDAVAEMRREEMGVGQTR